MLLFTPELCAGDPLATLEAAREHVDVVQVRVKHAGDTSGPSPARELHDWSLRVLDLLGPDGPAVLVNDRVDVALALQARGVAGVHLGDRDCPPEIAREQLGPEAWIGLSTHSVGEVALHQDGPLNYLGFGPVHATATKLGRQPLGPDIAWVAQAGSALPLYPIGGIDETNADALSPVGRAAVSSAILAAHDPESAARRIRAALDPSA
jgi:thiamine-phosphate diphosphorylase